MFRWLVLATCASSLAVLGCSGVAGPVGPTNATVTPGMTREDVFARFGPGLVTGTKDDQINHTKWERHTYRSGAVGLSVEIVDGKVDKVSEIPNTAPETAAKIQVGMTMDQVLAAAGEPATGHNDKNPFPNQSWAYADAVAPIQSVEVQFKDKVVTSVKVFDNMAYSMGSTGAPPNFQGQ